MHKIEASLGNAQGSTKLTKSFLRLNLSDYIEEFFVGITHDKNMARFAEYFEYERPDLERQSPDFFTKFNLTHQATLDQYYKQSAIREDDLVFPIFTNYKMTSLD